MKKRIVLKSVLRNLKYSALIATYYSQNFYRQSFDILKVLTFDMSSCPLPFHVVNSKNAYKTCCYAIREVVESKIAYATFSAVTRVYTGFI